MHTTKELILDGGDTLDGAARKLRLNDTPDKTCVTVSTPGGVVAVLDRAQQHMLMLYLQDRLTDRRMPTTSRVFEIILASLNYDGKDINSLTVGEIRRSLP